MRWLVLALLAIGAVACIGLGEAACALGRLRMTPAKRELGMYLLVVLLYGAAVIWLVAASGLFR